MSDSLHPIAMEPELRAEVGVLANTEQILLWMQSKGLPLNGLELLIQDEYNHDLLVPLTDGRWLVFAAT